MAVLGAEFGADPGEGGGEAAAVVGQHVGEAEGDGGGGLTEEGDGALLGLVVFDGEVDGAGAPVNGDVEVALPPFAVGGLQLGQVLDVDMDEAEVVVLELALATFGPVRGRRWPPAQSFGPQDAQDAPDAVAVEVRQEMADHEGEVVEGEVGRLAQGADHGALLVGGLPGQLMRPGGVIEAVVRAALAPLADGLGADDGGGAGIGVDLQHGSSPVQLGGPEALKAIGVLYNRQPNWVPTMLRDQTVRPDLRLGRKAVIGGPS